VKGAAFFLALGLLSEPGVKPGLDVLRAEGAGRLSGKRVGLITNDTGRTIDGVPALQVLRGELGLEVVALLSPVHGYRGDAAAGDVIE
jgi:uncharacterized protein YbbC (DUF1343 family)